MIRERKNFFLLLIILTVFSCSEEKNKGITFDFYFSEKTMIINEEQDNQIEGTYLKVESLKNEQLKFNLPSGFYITNYNCHKWGLGWGNKKAYHDNGSENIREIVSIDQIKQTVVLGKLLKGRGYPKENQQIVFWNRSSSGFNKTGDRSVLDLKKWPEFAGKSNSFGGIEYDQRLKRWVMLFQECDTVKQQIYGAESSDLKNWIPSKSGKPILTYHQFKHISWAEENYKTKQTPVISDVKYLHHQWIILLNGKDKNGQRTIGFGISKQSILGPYQITKQAIFNNDLNNTWNNNGNFSAKLTYNDKQKKYIIAFDGIHKTKMENVGLAFSEDLIHWKQFKNNPVISDHTGWRSKKESSEINFIEWKNDTIILLISGTKQLKQGIYARATDEMNRSNPGNTDDAQLGVYISTDNGNTFHPHKNNPVIVNDYTNFSENEHMGGNVKFIQKDSLLYFFYQAKTSYKGLKYSIYLRTKKI